MKTYHLSILGATLLLASACAEVKYPDIDRGDGNKTTNADGGVPALDNADDARWYIARARKNMLDERSKLANTELGTDAMIATGAVGGLLGGALHWSGKAIIKLATVSASGALLSDSLAPRTQMLVLDQGISALDCVAKQAPIGFAKVVGVGSALKAVHEATAKLRNDLSYVQSDQYDSETMSDARAALVEAEAYLESNRPPVFEQVRLVTNAVITATNATMRKAVADPKAFAEEVKNLNIVTPTTPPGNTPPVTAPKSPPSPPSQPTRAEFDRMANADKELLNEKVRIYKVEAKLYYDLHVLKADLAGARDAGRKQVSRCVLNC